MKLRRKKVILIVLVIALIRTVINFKEPILRILREQPAELKRAEREIEAETRRCQMKSLGCFQALPSLFISDMMNESLTPSKCFAFCYDMSMLYASLSNGSTCYCGENFLGVALLTSTKDCRTPCSGDPTKLCGGVKSAQVYMILGCYTDFSSLSILGCLSSHDSESIQLPSDKLSTSECILQCEARGFSVAAVAGKCTCGYQFNVIQQTEQQDCIEGKVYKTFLIDDVCDNKTLLDPGTAPPVALASFPGSGNTWFRQMIETATGVYTGSVYDEEYVFTLGFIGEKLPFDSGKTVVIKDHVVHSTDYSSVWQSAILLIRDPYDAILAEYNRFRTLGHVEHVGEDLLKSRDFRLFVNRKAAVWKSTYTKLIQKVPRLLPIYFEDSVLDPVSQIRRILEFLPSDCLSNNADLKTRFKCLEYDVTGQFKRPKRELTFDPYTPELKLKINENIGGLRKELAKVEIYAFPSYERYPAAKPTQGKVKSMSKIK